MRLTKEIFQWLRMEGAVQDGDGRALNGSVFELSPFTSDHVLSGNLVAKVLARHFQRTSGKNGLGLPGGDAATLQRLAQNQLPSAAPSERLYTWNALGPVLDRLGVDLTFDDKSLIVAGDEEVAMNVLGELRRKIAAGGRSERESFGVQGAVASQRSTAAAQSHRSSKDSYASNGDDAYRRQGGRHGNELPSAGGRRGYENGDRPRGRNEWQGGEEKMNGGWRGEEGHTALPSINLSRGSRVSDQSSGGRRSEEESSRGRQRWSGQDRDVEVWSSGQRRGSRNEEARHAGGWGGANGAGHHPESADRKSVV